MEKVIKVGVLGCANIAVRSVIPAFQNNPRFKIEAIASRNLSKVNPVAEQYKCKAYSNYDSLLSDSNVNLVYCPLPTGLHYEWVMKALSHGKHVLCEKSLGVDSDEVSQMVDLARKNNLLLMENFQFRFHSQTQWVRDYISSGKLGELRCFRSQFGFPPFQDTSNIRYKPELGGGALLDAGAYTLKSTTIILPDEKFQVKAATMITPESYDVDIYGGIFMESQNGVIAELAYGFDNFYQCGYEIWGSKAKLSALRAYTAPPSLEPIIVIETPNEGRREIKLPSCDHFYEMTNRVADLLSIGDFEEEYLQNIIQSNYITKVKTISYGK